MKITSTKITRITRKAGTVTQNRVTRTILMVTNCFLFWAHQPLQA